MPQGQATAKRFTVIVITILSLGALALLVVNMMSAEASFQKHDLQSQLSNLVSEQQALERTVISAESPENLVKAAYRMGMVPAGSPAFIRLSDRKVLGTPMAASSQGR
jgi:cell division protein FtsL